MKTWKRLTASALLAALLFTLGACRDETPEYTFDDIYVIMTGNAYNVSTLNKFNVLTHEYSVLCPDPVCKHTTADGCLFADVVCTVTNGSDIFFVSNGKIYKDASTGAAMLPQTFCRYNYETGEVKTLCTVPGTRFEGIQGHIDYDGGYVYYCLRSDDPRTTSFKLWRVREDGGEPEDMNLELPFWVAYVAAGRAYCEKDSAMYTVDLTTGEWEKLYTYDEGKRVSVKDVEQDGSVVFERREGEVRAIVRIRPDGCEEELVTLTECGSTLYYQYYLDESETTLYAYSIPEKKSYWVCTMDAERYERWTRMFPCGLGVVVDYLIQGRRLANAREGVDFDRYVYLVKDFTER
ncbi:MAG: hypothetical protein ACI3XP_03485 [Eubacteriales bacterium]